MITKNLPKISINFHSIVDVITNSSTVIYVQCTSNTIKMTKELINSILNIAKSDKMADDLFDFKIVTNEENEVDSISDNLDDYEKDALNLGFTKEDIDGGWEKRLVIAKTIYNAINTGKINEPGGWGKDYDGWDTRNLIITAKKDDQFTLNLTEQIKSIFDIDGCRDG